MSHYDQVYKHWNIIHSNLSILVESHISMAFFSVIVYLSSYIFQIVGISVVSEIIIWNIHLWQLQYSVDFYCKSKIRTISVKSLMEQYQSTLQYIFDINPIFSKGLFSVLIVSLPVNCFFVLDLITGNETFIFRVTILTFSFQQWISIFLIHFAVANQNTKFLKITKQMMTIPFHNQIKFRTKITLNLFIQTFYTKKTYGITYWIFGLVSLFAFIEFLLLYGQFMMFLLQNP